MLGTIRLQQGKTEESTKFLDGLHNCSARKKSRASGDGQPKAAVPSKSVLSHHVFSTRPCVASINNLDFCACSFRNSYLSVDGEAGESLAENKSNRLLHSLTTILFQFTSSVTLSHVRSAERTTGFPKRIGSEDQEEILPRGWYLSLF